MQSISLKKILLKREILSLLRGLVTQLSSPIVIQDQEGKVLVADLGMDTATISNANTSESSENLAINEDLNKIPVMLSDEILGWVMGKEQVEQVADFLSYIVNREFEQKTLAADALDKYREINLLYIAPTDIDSTIQHPKEGRAKLCHLLGFMS
jgi:adenylate cyclase